MINFACEIQAKMQMKIRHCHTYCCHNTAIEMHTSFCSSHPFLEDSSFPAWNTVQNNAMKDNYKLKNFLPPSAFWADLRLDFVASTRSCSCCYEGARERESAILANIPYKPFLPPSAPTKPRLPDSSPTVRFFASLSVRYLPRLRLL